MCDYSLEAYRSRPAEEGEKLTLERFPSGSMGFTTGPACDLAVCVPAESHLLLQGIGDTVRESCGVGAVEEVGDDSASKAVPTRTPCASPMAWRSCCNGSMSAWWRVVVGSLRRCAPRRPPAAEAELV